MLDHWLDWIHGFLCGIWLCLFVLFIIILVGGFYVC